MVKYVVYNKLYVGSKPVGKKFKAYVGNDKTEVLRKARKANSNWNKFQKKEKDIYRAKIFEVKKVGVARKKRRSNPYRWF